MTTTLARLTECDTMLVHITTHYGTTIRRLNEAQPGYAARTPGSGEPGGGKGFTAGSTVERQAGKRTPEQTDLQDALELPNLIRLHASETAIGAHLTLIGVPNGPHIALRRLVWTRWLLRQLIEQNHPAPSRPLGALHRACVELDAITRRWGQPARVPPTTATNKLADDPTELWCRNCLNVGIRSPRWRGDLDRWCYEFNNSEGFLPPPALLKIREAKPRVTQRDVEPFIRAFAERNKKKRRRAG